MNKVEIRGFCAIWAFERYHNDKFWKKMVLELTSQSTTTGLLFGSLAFD